MLKLLFNVLFGMGMAFGIIAYLTEGTHNPIIRIAVIVLILGTAIKLALKDIR